MSRVLRILAALTMTLLVASLLQALTLAPAQAAKKCYAVRSAGESQSHLECYRILKRIRVDYKVGYRDALVNRTNRTANFECEATEQKTFSFGASAKLTTEVKLWLLGRAEAEFGVDVSRSKTSGYATRAGVKVPARTTTYCDRVVFRERFRVCKTSVYYGQESDCRVLTYWAPARRGWVLRDA
jgi:hypothetical protein